VSWTGKREGSRLPIERAPEVPLPLKEGKDSSQKERKAGRTWKVSLWGR